jgi:hypothetical protein
MLSIWSLLSGQLQKMRVVDRLKKIGFAMLAASITVFSLMTTGVSPALAAPGDAILSNLVISSGTLTPVFSPTTTSYTVNVENNVSSVTVTPTFNSDNLTVTVNSENVTSDQTSTPVTLIFGNNNISIVVTTLDSSDTNTYTVNVIRADDATLNKLEIITGTLTPTFDSNIYTYTVNVGNSMSSINLTPTVNKAGATMTVNNTPVPSGQEFGPINLTVGTNTITIVVTAPTPQFQKTYTVTVTRAASGDATLSNLTISAGTLNPAFISSTYSYTVSVTNNVTSVTITPWVNSAGSIVTVNSTSVPSGQAYGPILLNVGNNIITIVVTAPDTSFLTYTLTVTRMASNDATLSGLTISSGTLNPSFASATTGYTVSLANSVSSVTVTPTASSAGARVTVNSANVTSGQASASISLNEGNNTITIIVTAPDTSFQTYTITVTRAASNDATLSGLTISSGTLNPSFASATTGYTVSVVNGISSITVTPTVNSAGSTVTVNSASVTSGQPSAPVNLNVGSNTISVLVTAINGSTTQTYTLTVNRASADSGGGGGGGGFSGGFIGGGGGVASGPGVTALSPFTNYSGLFNLSATAKSDDNQVIVNIAAGVTAHDKDGSALKSITILPVDSPQDTPLDSQIIGLVYECTPKGATFSPSISLTFSYDPASLPENIRPGDLSIALYNPNTSTWELLASVPNAANSSVTSDIEHFSIYTIIGEETPEVTPTTEPVPAPADFNISDIQVTPASSLPGEIVAVSTMVGNTGGSYGEYTVTLKINSSEEDTKQISLAPGDSQTVTFTFTRQEAGSYTIDVNGLTSSLTIRQTKPSVKPTQKQQTSAAAPLEKLEIRWPVIISIAGGSFVVAVFAAFLFVRQRRR